MMTEPLDYESLFNRWDDLTKAELWSLGSGELHNIVDVAQARLDAVLALHSPHPQAAPQHASNCGYCNWPHPCMTHRAATGDA